MDTIITKNLVKKYKDKLAVDNMNLKIQKGELFALLGVNGAGKTTTIKMLSGLILPTSGEINVLGMNMRKDMLKIKELINVSPQETAVAPNLTVYENLEFMAGVYQIKDQEKKIDSLIDKFQLNEYVHKKAKNLSGGIMRRLSIAISLINDPEILFLDEPTLGLDVIARKSLWKVIRELKKDKTIILTTHYMEEAESLSDKIGIMSCGHMVACGTKEELLKKAKTTNFEDAFVNLATGGEL